MQRVSNGYTIIEVLIFLAVSAVIFAATVPLISGRSASAQFSVSARDLQSKLQDWINNVVNGFPGGTVGQYHCQTIGNTKVQVDNGLPGNPDCIFLGKAIQFTDKSYSANLQQASQVFAYSVFGRRLNSNNELVANMAEAIPTPALGSRGCGGACNTGTADNLTDEYTLPGGIKVSELISAGSSGDSHFAGFYSSFNTEHNTGPNGASDLKAFQYPLGNVDPKSLEIYNCLLAISDDTLSSPCVSAGSNDPEPLTNWQVCLTDDKHYAVLTINSTNGVGVGTKLDFVGACP